MAWELVQLRRSLGHVFRRVFLPAFAGSWLVLGATAAYAQAAGAIPAEANEGDNSTVAALQSELTDARAEIARQHDLLMEQQRRLDLLEQRLAGLAQTTEHIQDQQFAAESRTSAGQSGPPVRGVNAAVGQAPADSDRPPTVAVLDQRGSVVTRRGELMAEFGVDYTRSDRNRAVFRGVEVLDSILIGAFDINENRQDTLTASASLRYGLTDRLEISARVPWVTRSEKTIATPIAGSTNDDAARTIDRSVSESAVGDVELSARYQLNNGGRNTPFLIAGLQASLPTGKDPFKVRRDEFGTPLEASTGAGYFSITPSFTAILPSEPAVLFGTVGYTFNLSETVEAKVPPMQIDRINPGDLLTASAGIGFALNNRSSVNFGYTHSWAFGTKTRVRQLDEQTGEPYGPTIENKTRSLQIGRFLFGVSHKFSKNVQLNWSVEVGATEDAPDARTMLRLPIRF